MQEKTQFFDENNNNVGYVYVFSWDEIPEELSYFFSLSDAFDINTYVYYYELSPISRGDLIRLGLMDRTMKIGRFYEKAVAIFRNANLKNLTISCGDSISEDTDDGILEYIAEINQDIENFYRGCGTDYENPKDALAEGIKNLKMQHKLFIWELKTAELYEEIDGTEHHEIFPNFLKMCELELWQFKSIFSQHYDWYNDPLIPDLEVENNG